MKSYDAIVQTCCHHVKLHYWDFTSKLTEDLKEILKEHGEERAKECIIEGNCSGELNYCYFNGKTEEEIRGWWKIDD